MSKLVRLSFSIEEGLYNNLEKMINLFGYENRSEFIRDLLREKLIDIERKKDKKQIGTVTIVYDHKRRELGEKLTSIQHEHHSTIIAATHIHLDEVMCAEAIIVKGEASKLEHLLYQLKKQKGVIFATLSVGPLKHSSL